MSSQPKLGRPWKEKSKELQTALSREPKNRTHNSHMGSKSPSRARSDNVNNGPMHYQRKSEKEIVSVERDIGFERSSVPDEEIDVYICEKGKKFVKLNHLYIPCSAAGAPMNVCIDKGK